MHHGTRAPVIPIRPQSSGQVFPILTADFWHHHCDIVDLAAVTTIAFIDQILRGCPPVFCCSRFLHRVKRRYVLDFLVATIGQHDIVVTSVIPIRLGRDDQVLGILARQGRRRRIMTDPVCAMTTVAFFDQFLRGCPPVFCRSLFLHHLKRRYVLDFLVATIIQHDIVVTSVIPIRLGRDDQVLGILARQGRRRRIMTDPMCAMTAAALCA